MARPISGPNRLAMMDQLPPIESITPKPQLLLQPPMGMNPASRANMLQPGECKLVQNLTIRDGAYKTRDATELVGSAAGSPLIYAADIRLPNNDSFILRWRENGVDWLTSGAFAQIGYSGRIEGTAGSVLALTSWNQSLVFGTQVGKLYWLQFYPVPAITEIVDSPTTVIHLTTFAGRIVASLSGTRIQWSVKNDNEDWTGLGSGFEDLLGSPGSVIDSQCAVIPVTDEQAFAIRSNSIWLMTQTGNFDAPFRFSQMYTGFGCRLPGTCCAIPGGAAFLGNDDVLIVTTNGFKRVGKQIRRVLNAVPSNFRFKASMVYEPRENELRLSVPDGDGQASQKVWRYSVERDAWTQDTYQFGIRSISFTRFSKSLIDIDGLSTIAGSIDSLTGVIDELGVMDPSVGCIYAMSGTAGLVGRDSEGRNNNTDRDVDSGGLDVAGEFRIETGNIYGGPTLKKTHIHEVHVEYESEGAQQILMEYSDDGGANWHLYDVITVQDTLGRIDVLCFRQSLYRDSLQLSLSCQNCKTFRLINMFPVVSEGARIQDAR